MESDFKLGDFRIDEPRPIKVVIIGAGFSGIAAGIRFLQRVPNIHLTIYDANDGIGGTWYVNRYPGCTCDIPSHAYQYTFADNPNWSSFYPPALEILKYLESVVGKYNLMPYIKLQHRLVRAEYSEPEGKWKLQFRLLSPTSIESGSAELEDSADVLFTGLGGLSRWKWPEIEGLKSFQGKIIHSANWDTGEGNPKKGWEDTVKSWGDKKVAVIGVGSTAIQIVPALQPRVKHLTNYVRGKTWISSTFAKEDMLKFSGGEETTNYKFTEEEKAKFRDDPAFYKKFRTELESNMNIGHIATLRYHPMQLMARQAFKADMMKRLAKKPWIADHLIPDFGVACRRLTPGPGYLEALCEDNVEFIPSIIKRVTPSGIETEDGNHQDFDIIICATGFDTTYQLGFPIIGRGRVQLSEKYIPYPRTYLSVAVDGFPNWFQALGPNSTVGAGSLLIVIERQVEYAVAATMKIQREWIKSMEPKREAVIDWDQYTESFFPTSVFGEKCRSWYKAGKEEGRVLALWPGSCLHAARALRHPRWEDFNYEYMDEAKGNSFYWLGDGNTVADHDVGGNRAWYLNDEEVDIPQVGVAPDAGF